MDSSSAKSISPFLAGSNYKSLKPISLIPCSLKNLTYLGFGRLVMTKKVSENWRVLFSFIVNLDFVC